MRRFGRGRNGTRGAEPVGATARGRNGLSRNVPRVSNRQPMERRRLECAGRPKLGELSGRDESGVDAVSASRFRQQSQLRHSDQRRRRRARELHADCVHAISDRERSRSLSNSGKPANRGRQRRTHADRRRCKLQTLRDFFNDELGRCLERRQRCRLRSWVGRTSTRELDLGRCRRITDCRRPRPLRRSPSGRDRSRRSVHGEHDGARPYSSGDPRCRFERRIRATDGTSPAIAGKFRPHAVSR